VKNSEIFKALKNYSFYHKDPKNFSEAY